jgi:hypothetical protein
MMMSFAPILPPGGLHGGGGQPQPTPPPPSSTPVPAPVLREITYSQAAHPMGQMWDPTNWSASTVDADFTRVANLHADTIRVFVEPKAFGYPSPYLRSSSVQELQQLLQIAANHGLKVHLTLFDDFTDFTNLTDSRQFIDSLLGYTRGNPAISFYELRNEIVFTDSDQRKFMETLLPKLRDAAGGSPVTVSVLGQIGDFLNYVNNETVLPDFYSYHYYNYPSVARDVIRQAVDATSAKHRSMYLGEVAYATGISDTKFGIPPTKAAQEWAQEQYFRQVAQAARDLGMPSPPAVWELYDRCASCTDLDGTFGIYHNDGTPKPAANTVASIFAGNPISQVFGGGADGLAGGYPAYWRLSVPTAATFGQSTTVYHSGTASGQISQSGSRDAGGTMPAYMLAPIKAVDEGTTYTVSAWVRGASATGTNQVQLRWYDGGERLFADDASVNLPAGTTNWTQLTVTAKAPQYARYVLLAMASENNSGTVWFDDITFG